MKSLALLVLLAAAPAWAQSKRYPPVPPDKDLEEETRSELWESTLKPDLKPYQELLRDAKRLIDHGTKDDLKAAHEKLEAAIKRVPTLPEAYLLRGTLYLQHRQWANCADDLGAAEDRAKTDPSSRTKSRIDLGVCQARAGRHADAETTLVRASASAASYRGELWMRLGEVRIALGKLDEAIDALLAALEATDSSNDMTRWLLAAAYDRARKPTEALEHAQRAKSYDQSFTFIQNPRLPLLGAGDTEYLYGVAYRYALPKPEYALLYFRRYVKLAPDSAWKRRAEDHVRELSTMKLPAKETITHMGTSAVVLDTMRATIEQSMPAMRACLGKLPSSAFQVSVRKVGPRTPPTTRDYPTFRLPAAPKPVTNLLNLDGAPPSLDLDTAISCLETQVAKVKLPPPKERDTYYTMTFIVVSP